MNRLRIALFCRPVYLRTARVAKPNGARDFVKRHSCRIVPCPPDDFVFAVILHLYQMGMSSRRHKADKRRLQLFILYVIGADMPLNMMYAHKRDACCKADCLCLGNTY